MDTNHTTRGKIRYWQKFSVVLAVGIILLVASSFLKNSYLQWSAGIVLAISGWYAIMSLFEFFDKVEDR